MGSGLTRNAAASYTPHEDVKSSEIKFPLTGKRKIFRCGSLRITDDRPFELIIYTSTVQDICAVSFPVQRRLMDPLALSLLVDLTKSNRHPARKERNRWKGNHAVNKNEMFLQTGIFFSLVYNWLRTHKHNICATAHVVSMRLNPEEHSFFFSLPPSKRDIKKMLHRSV